MKKGDGLYVSYKLYKKLIKSDELQVSFQKMLPPFTRIIADRNVSNDVAYEVVNGKIKTTFEIEW